MLAYHRERTPITARGASCADDHARSRSLDRTFGAVSVAKPRNTYPATCRGVAITSAESMLVAHRGFEPLVSALRGRCPRPLDECAVTDGR